MRARGEGGQLFGLFEQTYSGNGTGWNESLINFLASHFIKNSSLSHKPISYSTIAHYIAHSIQIICSISSSIYYTIKSTSPSIN